MSGVTGPIHSLPGSGHSPEGMCDDHDDRPATHRVQGETDSFGCEMHDMCDECYQAWRVAPQYGDDLGRCDYCRHETANRRPIRDYEEGLGGPVYYVCEECRARVRARELEEAQEWDHDNPDCGDYADASDEDDWNYPVDWIDPPYVRQSYVAIECKKCRQHWREGHKCHAVLAASA